MALAETGLTLIERLPQVVQTRLQHGAHSVLVNAAQLAAVRSRFDDEQAESLARYLEASQSANTVRAYRSDWLGWSAWCLAEGKQALPGDPLDAAVYLAAAADARKATGEWLWSMATLERKIAAIAAVHAAHGFASPTRSDVTRLTLRGIRRSRRTHPVRKRPILLHTLLELFQGLPAPEWPSGIARRRDMLLLLMGFAGALRRSELAALTIDDVSVDTDMTTGEPMLLVRLGSTKTDPTGIHEQRVVLPRGQQPHTCPVCAFAAWIEVLEAADKTEEDVQRILSVAYSPAVHRCHAFTDTSLRDGCARPLFPAVHRYGQIGTHAMTDRAVALIVKRYAIRAGLDPRLFSGHSLRAGFATQAALGGASDREIMRQGRWTSSHMVHRYIRTANPLDDNAVTKLGL